ncbi:MarR family transcriptional regulator [Gluconacetobacter azotocaptans]|uniref:MarR family transcriptional regulator n=1 Tax=Gluconacetobacter azotocaptans TaxID=142834 RepID=A0A7W4JT11_9PROT|nr:MarR family transcriptional regulator [Gluconacetobacter azotocaptans]MBB2190235.1 MarR family transcriptional regulator [Gluconacetobacter azotocaptans]GBQ35872.1 MarR family transcriptional regulator [Gluconacetobacter azotocaptans DSM 13594]
MTSDGWNLTRTPGHYISRIARALMRIGDVRLREVGFASGQLPVLSALSNGETLSQSELARLAKVEQPTMAQLLARMERDGLIHRTPDPKDRRSSLVSLSDAARSRIPAGRAILRQANRDATKGMTDAEVATLIDLLQRVLANVNEMDR